jgi:hypothetical protein
MTRVGHLQRWLWIVSLLGACLLLQAPVSASASPSPTTFVVDTSNDATPAPTAPHYDLATAILAADADPGSTIEFTSAFDSNADSDTINAYELPPLTEPMTIDGCSVPGQPVDTDEQCTPGAYVTPGNDYYEYDAYPTAMGSQSALFDVTGANVTIRGLNITDPNNAADAEIDADSGFAKDFTLQDSDIQTDDDDTAVQLGGDDATIGGLGTDPADTLMSKADGGGDGNTVSVEKSDAIEVFGGDGDQIDGNQIDIDANDTGVYIENGSNTSIVANALLQGDGNMDGKGIEVAGGQNTAIGEPGNVDPQSEESLLAPANNFGSGFASPILLNDGGGALSNMAAVYQATGSDEAGHPFITFDNGNENSGVTTPAITSATADAIFGTADDDAEITVVAVNGPAGDTSSINSIVAVGSATAQGTFAIPFQTPVGVGSYLNVYETIPGTGSSLLAGAVKATSPPIAAFSYSAPNDTDPATSSLRPVRPQQSVSFDASSSFNVTNTSVSYTWNWGDGTTSSPDTSTGQSPTATHTYTKAGVYTVQLLLDDTTGAGPEESVATETVTVAPDQPPVAVIQSPGSGVFSTTIEFDGSKSYDPDGEVVNYQVSLVDSGGNTVTADNYNSTTPPSTLNLPSTLGTYKATLTVTDDEGATDSQTIPIAVTNPPAPPVTPTPDVPVATPPSSTLDRGQSNLLAAEQQASTGGEPIPVACGTDSPSLGACVAADQLTAASTVGHFFDAIGGNPDIVMDSSGQFKATSFATDASGGSQIVYTAPDVNLNGVAIQQETPGTGTITITTDIDSGKLDFISLQSAPGSDYAVTFDGMRLYAGAIDWSIFGAGSTTGAPASGFATQFDNINGLSSFTAAIGVDNSYNFASPTLNGVTVTSFTPFTFSGGQANTNVTNQLPSALGTPAAGQLDGSAAGPTSPSAIPISNNSIANAVAAALNLANGNGGDSLFDDAFGDAAGALGLTSANAASAGSDCATQLSGTLPTGSGAVAIGFPSADLGGIPLSAVTLTIDGTNHFILEADASLPTGEASLMALVEIDNGSFRFGCAEASFPEPGSQLGAVPVFLSSINLGFLSSGTQWVINGGTQFTAGPQAFGQTLLSADVDATAVFPGSTAPLTAPWGFQLNGTVQVLPGLCASNGTGLCVEANANLVYASTGYFRGSLTFNSPLGALEVAGGISGGIDPPTSDTDIPFDLNGNVTVGIPAINVLGTPATIGPESIGADVDLTDVDQSGDTQLTACTTVNILGAQQQVEATVDLDNGSISAGLTCSDGQPSEFVEPTCAALQSDVTNAPSSSDPNENTDSIAYQTDETLLAVGPPGACTDSSDSSDSKRASDRSGTTKARPAMILRARSAAHADTAHTSSSATLNPGQAEAFEVSNSGETEEIAATAATAPPNITVIPPDGNDYASVTSEQDLATDTTTIDVTGADEQAGAWNVVVASGSSAVTNLTETERMNASVTGSVTSTGARTEQLSYDDQIPAGDTVQFTEVGSDSTTQIGTAGPGSGTLDWTIANGSAGTRTVEAMLVGGGSDYSNDDVATFTAPGPQLPLAPSNVSLKSDGNGGATLSYTPDQLTQSVMITVDSSSGRDLEYTEPASTTSINIPNVVPGSSLTATLYGVDNQDREGASASVRATIGTASAAQPIAAPPFTPVTTTTVPPGGSKSPVRPVLTKLKQVLSKWAEGTALPSEHSIPPHGKLKAGTIFSFTLNTAASVDLAFKQPAKGVSVGGKCEVTKTRKKKAKACTTTTTLGTLTYKLSAGNADVSFQGRLSSGKKLPVGKYTLAVSATNSVGTTAVQTLKFTIVKPKAKHHKKKK